MIADDLFAGAGGCLICGEPVPVASRGVTCTFSCRAKLRESRKTAEWRKPREYPAELVQRVRHLYADEGMTIAEVQTAVGPGNKVELIMRRYSIERREAVKRNQAASANSTWVGDSPSYGAAHTRVYSARGRASDHSCVDCGERAKDWSYLGGCPVEQTDSKGRTFSANPAMYAARCRRCHRAYDSIRRAA